MRFHTCYSINVAPRVHDLEMKQFVDLMLKIRAQAYLDRGGESAPRARVAVWKDVKLPDDKILIPGVVSHCVYQVEHPELVASASSASRGGRTRAGDRRHRLRLRHLGRGTRCIRTWLGQSSLPWEGARIATSRLWSR